MNLRDLQLWLNAHGASLTVDGRAGPATRSAILNVFVNRDAAAVTSTDIAQIAARLGGTPRQVTAVAKVESAGGGWDNSGRLKCLYERHYFWRRLRIVIPVLSNPSPGGYTNDADSDGINDSWEKVADAAMRSPIAAFESASFGRFQIMGAHAKSLGYANAVEFVWALSRSEAAQYDALARFIDVNNLRAAFQRLSANPDHCRAFAKGYNGGGYEKGGYHRKLAAEMS